METKKQAVKPSNSAAIAATARNKEIAPQEDGKKKKKKKKGLGKVIVILLLLIIIGGAVLCYMMNYFGVKTIVIGFFVEQDDQYVKVMRLLTQKQTELDSASVDLENRTGELDKREAELDKKEASLKSQEESLTKQKAEVKAEKKLLQDVIVERAEVISIINSMSADNAAKMLENYRSIYEVAGVLAELDMKKSAKIIEAFTPAMAAKITEQMLSLSGDVTADGSVDTANP